VIADAPGPSWLSTELPYPIARAWQQVRRAEDTDAQLAAAVAAVEVALRLVAALQLANLLDGTTLELPEILDDFNRPTLGSFAKLTRQLGPLLAERAFAPELVSWPERHHGDERSATKQRNLLAHWDELDPARRAEERGAFLELAAELLGSLAWLRSYPLLRFSRPEASDEQGIFVARVTDLRGYDGHLRAPAKMRLRGWPRADRLYLWDRAGRLLDLHPFLYFARPEGGDGEELVVWKGLGRRSGDVRIGDNEYHADNPGWSDTAERSIAVQLLDPLRPGDAPAPALARAPARLEGTAATRRRGLIIGLAVAAVVALAIPIAAGLGDLSDVQTSTRGAAGSCPDDLVGTWLFQTQVLGAKQRFKARAEGVRAHYELVVKRGPSCPLQGVLTRTGYTEKGEFREHVRSGAVKVASSRTGDTAVLADVRLTAPGVPEPVEMSLRLGLVDGALYGVWRNEGAMGDERGYWGTLVGHDEAVGRAVPPGMPCLKQCPAPCDQRSDPRNEATEACLLACARKAEACSE
jgi:hypothetical protein